nr:helix-turn-helix domain-containing protein [Rhodovulum euryhalinum]
MPDSAPTVTEAAITCGFGHLGRFSAAYRARFGEAPSQTRARR